MAGGNSGDHRSGVPERNGTLRNGTGTDAAVCENPQFQKPAEFFKTLPAQNDGSNISLDKHFLARRDIYETVPTKALRCFLIRNHTTTPDCPRIQY